MPDGDSIVIVGGGHAGAQLCGALAAAGRARGVHLVCEEPESRITARRCRKRS